MTKHIVFVYGTLKRPYGNHRCIEGAKFLGTAVSVEANFVMKHVGVPILWEHPLPPAGDTNRVAGEVYEITDEQLERCDRLEGHPRMYKREERKFWLHYPDTPKEITAWVYLWQRSLYGEDVPVVDGAYDWDPSKITRPRFVDDDPEEDEDYDEEEETIEE